MAELKERYDYIIRPEGGKNCPRRTEREGLNLFIFVFEGGG